MLDATDIVEVVGDALALKRKGREFVGLCPFHDDRNPSMCVVPHKQIFHCFVCGSGGNAIDFVMRYHGLEFLDALKQLAERAGIELTPRGGAGSRGEESAGSGVTKGELERANAFAASFFRTVFQHGEHGKAARDLVRRRGISTEMLESFAIGAAPNRWDGLAQTVRNKGADVEAFVAAGLLKRRGDGSLYDAFRNRLMFPILNQAGRPVAFGGRVVDPEDEGPKYWNSPETAAFHKSAVLFGLWQANRPIQTSRRAVVTEGYTDVVACHQAGFENVVATLGTALTDRHASVLRRLCDEVVLLFDGDEAGMRAAERAFEVFFREPVDVKVAVLPGGADPDELLQSEGGSAAFRAALDGAADLLEYRFERLRSSLDASGRGVGSAGRTRAVEEYLENLVGLGLGDLSPMRQRAVLSRLASISGTDMETVTRAARAGGARRRRRRAEEEDGEGPGGVRGPRDPRGAAENALACLLAEPGLVRSCAAEAGEVLGTCGAAGGAVGSAARAVAGAAAEEPDELTLSAVLARLGGPEDEAARGLAVSFSTFAERVTEHDAESLRRRFADCARTLRQERLVLMGPDDGEAAAGAAVEVEGAGSSAAADRLARVRELHKSLGGNPRAIPRRLG